MTKKLQKILSNGKPRCQVILGSTGEQCKREATVKGLFCNIHKMYNVGDIVTPPAQIKRKLDNDVKNQVYNLIEKLPEFRSEVDKINAIKDRVKKYQENSDLNNLDIPIAYLHDLRTRIENSSKLSEPAKIDLLEKNLKTLYQCLEKRAKIIRELKFSVTLDEFRLFVKKIIESIDHVVKDIEMRKSIKREIIRSYRESLPLNEKV